MKNFIAALASVALVACSTQPVFANDFGGIYVQGTAGVEDVTQVPSSNDVIYGASAGVNVPLGNVIVGVEGTLDNVFQDEREFGASGRFGYTFSNVMLYGEAGYTNYRDVFSRELEGLRVGGGIEANISPHAFVSAEYRYSDLEANVGKHAGLIGLGLRF